MQKVVKLSNRQIAKSPNRQNTLNRPLAETSALATAQRIKRAPLKSLLFLPFLFCFAALSGPRRAQRASMECPGTECNEVKGITTPRFQKMRSDIQNSRQASF